MNIQRRRIMRRHVIYLMALAVVFSFSIPAEAAETYPSKPVEVIIPYDAGGAMDITARILAEHAKKYLGQPLVAVNRSAGGGAVGFSTTAQARPDGYTIAIISTPAILHEFMIKGTTYTYKSFAPITQVAFESPYLVVQKGGAFDRPLGEFIEYVRKNPEKVRIGIGGTWSVLDICRVLMEREAKIKFTRVPFAGGAPAVTSLLGGHVDAIIVYLTEFQGHYDAGKLQPIGLAREDRSGFLPKVPTFKESGLPVVYGTWRVMAGPAKTPSAIVQTLESAFMKAMRDPATLEAYRKAGIEIKVRGSKETQQYIEEQRRLHDQLFKEFGVEAK
jgi:tripartite-type tricarboxylate transporter receptor subunit TctC